MNNWIIMQIEDILNHFEDPNGRFPKEALNSALEQQEAITPYLLSILENTISNKEYLFHSEMVPTLTIFNVTPVTSSFS